jgi:tyrosyl-tRNA synthetase
MQGYDAYALKADVQVGGTEQLFNIITAARKLMTFLGAKPNIGITMSILPGTDGEIRMSKSLGNHIPLNTTPEDMYGKVMSLPDKAMSQYFRLVTRYTVSKIGEIERGLAEGRLHPRDVKMQLAREIVEIYYGEQLAAQAEQDFINVFQQGSQPEEIPEFHYQPGLPLVDILVASGLASSKSEARRLVAQNGVRLDGQILSDPSQPFPHPGILQAGKRRFVRVVEG